MYLNPNLIVLK